MTIYFVVCFRAPKCRKFIAFNAQNIFIGAMAIYLITLALQRALSLCFDTTLSLQAIAMIFWHFAHQSGPPKIVLVFFHTTHTLQASLENI